MRIGPLRHRIQIQAPTLERGPRGEWSNDFDPVVTRWGSISPLTGREQLDAGKMEATVTHRIVIRYYAQLKPTYRLISQGRVYNIESIVNVDLRRRTMEILAIEDPNLLYLSGDIVDEDGGEITDEFGTVIGYA